MLETYSYNRTGTVGCEIRDQDGSVVAWTVDEAWAAMIVALLAEADISFNPAALNKCSRAE